MTLCCTKISWLWEENSDKAEHEPEPEPEPEVEYKISTPLILQRIEEEKEDDNNMFLQTQDITSVGVNMDTSESISQILTNIETLPPDKYDKYIQLAMHNGVKESDIYKDTFTPTNESAEEPILSKTKRVSWAKGVKDYDGICPESHYYLKCVKYSRREFYSLLHLTIIKLIKNKDTNKEVYDECISMIKATLKLMIDLNERYQKIRRTVKLFQKGARKNYGYNPVGFFVCDECVKYKIEMLEGLLDHYEMNDLIDDMNNVVEDEDETCIDKALEEIDALSNKTLVEMENASDASEECIGGGGGGEGAKDEE